MRSVTPRELIQARWLSRLTSLLVVGLGLALVGVFLYLARGQTKSVAAELTYLLASVCVSAGLVALLLSRATLEETTLTTRATIEESVEAQLSPIRQALRQGGQSDYRWRCFLSLTPDAEGGSEYAWQVITIEKAVTDLPTDLRFLCFASFSDEVLRPYASDPRYQFRWVIDEALDPLNREHFDVQSVLVDGKPLAGKEAPVPGGAAAARLVVYPVPRAARENPGFHRISFAVLVRKHVGHDERIRIRTRLHATTFGAEFVCVVGESMPLRHASSSASEVSFLGPPGSGAVGAGEVQVHPNRPCVLQVRFDSPLQPGSAVSFDLDREIKARPKDR